MKAKPFTTVRVEAGVPWFWEDHVARLRETALALGFPLPTPTDLFGALPRAVGGALRVRITLTPDGGIETDIQPYEPPTEPWTLKRVPIDPDPDIVRFKTTSRSWYDAARDRLDAEDDALLVLAKGQAVAGSLLLETTVANLFFRIDGRVVTPAASAPLLPGIARARLLNGAPAAEEAVLTDADAGLASGCCVTNALLGAHPVGAIDGREMVESDRLARDLIDRLRSSLQESV
jgi:branched-subunit amino acid aminotransferase/4-amino-4-deoxychorismate lyase